MGKVVETYSASIVSNLEFLVLLAAPLCLDEVGGLVGMVLVQLLQEALVSSLREEALLVQQSHYTHGLNEGGRERRGARGGRERGREREREREGERERGRERGKERDDLPSFVIKEWSYYAIYSGGMTLYYFQGSLTFSMRSTQG